MRLSKKCRLTAALLNMTGIEALQKRVEVLREVSVRRPPIATIIKFINTCHNLFELVKLAVF